MERDDARQGSDLPVWEDALADDLGELLQHDGQAVGGRNVLRSGANGHWTGR